MFRHLVSYQNSTVLDGDFGVLMQPRSGTQVVELVEMQSGGHAEVAWNASWGGKAFMQSKGRTSISFPSRKVIQVGILLAV